MKTRGIPWAQIFWINSSWTNSALNSGSTRSVVRKTFGEGVSFYKFLNLTSANPSPVKKTILKTFRGVCPKYPPPATPLGSTVQNFWAPKVLIQLPRARAFISIYPDRSVCTMTQHQICLISPSPWLISGYTTAPVFSYTVIRMYTFF